MPIFPDFSWDEGGVRAELEVDQLDNVNLPHSGYFADVDFRRWPRRAWGTRQLRSSRGRGDRRPDDRALDRPHQGQGGSGLGTEIPFYDEFQLGGLFRLSGRPIGQLYGNTYALGAALLYYRLSEAGGLIIKNLSLGVSIEGGNTWAYQAPVTFSSLKPAGSIFVVADTLIGPFFLGYGHSGSKNSSAYLYLNRTF